MKILIPVLATKKGKVQIWRNVVYPSFCKYQKLRIGENKKGVIVAEILFI